MISTIFSLIKIGLFLFIVLVAYFSITYIWDQIYYMRGAYYRCTKRPRTQLNSRRGTRGEYEIYAALRKLEKEGWKFLFDLYIPKASGGTTEIDILAIGPQGIFCIESKDYTGEIYGNENAKNWVQVKPYLNDPSERDKMFYNPFMQNAGHVANLKKLLGDQYPSATFYSLVVFADRCQLYVPRSSEYLTEICQTKNVLKIFNQMRENGNEMDPEEVKAIYEQMKKYMRPNILVKAKHRIDCHKMALHN